LWGAEGRFRVSVHGNLSSNSVETVRGVLAAALLKRIEPKESTGAPGE
jgi:hypothetical protein